MAYNSVENTIAVHNDTKKIFWKCGACSNTFCFILNREFGHQNNMAELASNPLAGGLLSNGYQCGMLWGSALAVGAESFRRYTDKNYAIAVAVKATQKVMGSFEKRTSTVNCREITHCDLTTKWGMMKLMFKTVLTGFFQSKCFRLAKKWAPDAVNSAKVGLSEDGNNLKYIPVNCAVETAKRLGASDEEMIMVAGFAGGMGLSGNACGALGAAVWLKTLKWCRNNPGKKPSYSKDGEPGKILDLFLLTTEGKVLCKDIAGIKSNSIDEHTVYLQNGGCKNVIHALGQV